MNKKKQIRLIFQDEHNAAVSFAAGVSEWTKAQQDAHRGDGQAVLAVGIWSLLEEREKLRKMVEEAYNAGMAAVETVMWHEDDFREPPQKWEASRFPAAIERPWAEK